MAQWVIHYSDGRSFSSDDGPPEDAPRTGVQAVGVASQSCGNYVLSQQDYYCWHDGEGWIPHDLSGLYQYLAEPGREKIVLRGYWIGNEAFMKARQAARDDPRLPKVTARPPRLHREGKE